MKVYLASWFASRAEMQKRANNLRGQGIEVTSRWLEEGIKPDSQIADLGDTYLRETARVDIEDVLLANVVVLNTPSQEELKTVPITVGTWARGGRHFEAGFQYALMMFFKYLPKRIQGRGTRRLILVGRRENVFHYLDGVKKVFQADGVDCPEIPVFETWALALEFLVKTAKKEQRATAAGR